MKNCLVSINLCVRISKKISIGGDEVGGVYTFHKYRPLLRELISRDFKLKYRRSFLGYAWSLLSPFFNMLVITAVFSQIFKYNIENFPVYLLLGQTVFGFYSEATSSAMSSIFGNSELMKKVYVPKYFFPLSKVCFCFINMLCTMVCVVIVLMIQKVKIQLTVILFPILLLYVFLLVLGVGLLLSVVAVYFRDLLHLYSVLLNAQMYLTPLFYPADLLPELVYHIVQFNPMFHIVNYFRNIILYGIWPSFQDNVICLSFGLFFLFFGVIVFKKSQNKFVFYI